ncbi:MAG TPA: hypothetical protein VGL77_10450 [Armatimonadota bacterium]
MPAGGPSIWFGAFIGALATGMGRIISAIPSLLGAIIILLIGWGVGKVIQALVTKGLRAVHFNTVTERAGINSALDRAEIKTSPSTILGIVVYWFVFLIAINAAVSVLGIVALTTLMASVILYLPRIFVALLVLVVGAWAGSFLGRLTTASASTAGISYASILGGVVQGAVLFFTFAIALDTLGLSFPFLTTAFAVILGGMALAGSIAFGLGGREYAADTLAGRELRAVFVPGDRLVADNLDGTIESIQPTITLVQTAHGTVAVQNSDLMHRHATNASRNQGQGGSSSLPKAA